MDEHQSSWKIYLHIGFGNGCSWHSWCLCVRVLIYSSVDFRFRLSCGAKFYLLATLGLLVNISLYKRLSK